jgi:acyl-CoA reductase-like NAD-dependent aldehyde dehydrogenase
VLTPGAGPIVPLIKWSSEEEVIRRANDTNTGLGACVWTKDLEHACRVARRIEAGSVWINSYEKLAKEAYFSGHKESGLGGELGPQALMQWVQPHVLHIYHEKGETS